MNGEKMNNERIRFCGNCGHDVEVVPTRYICEKDGFYVYEAKCPRGHNFSVTSMGLNIIFLPEPPECYGIHDETQ